MNRRHDRPSATSPDLPGAAPDWAFFLDVDGTLLALAENPSAVVSDSRIERILQRLRDATDGALALVSGRPIAEIDRLFAALALPTAGQHGMERRDRAGTAHRHALHSARFGPIREQLARLAARHPRLIFEDKGLTLALHYRQAPRLAAYLHRQVRAWLEGSDDLRMQAGKRVIEIKPAGRDKGSAIREFMSEPPFQGRTPVFIGDDTTDEDGFAAVNQLGGHSIKVGTGATAARWRLADVEAVRAWLEQVADPLK